jgi:cadmium resistance protein CadD (predicted permease)
VSPGLAGQAVGLFAVTNVDDLLILALFFARGGPTRRIALGQYVGFAAILAVSVAAASGTTLLPARAIPYLGLLPIALGFRAAVQAWRNRGDDEPPGAGDAPGALAIAAVAFANGGDNIGVYVPVFATAGPVGTGAYAVVFLVLVAAWVAAGRSLATRPVVARVLGRWGHVVLPVALIGIGLLILVSGLRSVA